MVSIVEQDRYEQLVSNALAEMQAKTGFTQLSPGGKARSLIEIVSRETNNAYMTFDKQLLQSFLKYASGNALDMLGELLGLSRLSATRNNIPAALKIQRFYVEGNRTFGDIDSSSGGYFTIPRGTKVYTAAKRDQEPVVCYLTEDLVCQHTATEAYASIQSRDFGADSNLGAGTLINHNFEQYTDYLNGTLLTTNVESILYAREEETDEDYRYRLINQTLNSETANYIACRLAALTTAGVADILMDEYAYGIGSGAIYVKAVTPTPSPTLLENVQFNVHRVRAMGNYVTVRAPKPVGVELAVTLNLYSPLPADKDQELRDRVTQGIINYIDSLDIDETLDLATLRSKIVAMDSNIKSIGSYTQPLDEIYIWKYSASEDNRVRRKLIADQYVPQGFERVIVEHNSYLQVPIRVRTATISTIMPSAS